MRNDKTTSHFNHTKINIPSLFDIYTNIFNINQICGLVLFLLSLVSLCSAIFRLISTNHPCYFYVFTTFKNIDLFHTIYTVYVLLKNTKFCAARRSLPTTQTHKTFILCFSIQWLRMWVSLLLLFCFWLGCSFVDQSIGMNFNTTLHKNYNWTSIHTINLKFRDDRTENKNNNNNNSIYKY